MQQCGVIANSDVLTAEVFQLFRVKTCRAFADAVEVKPIDSLASASSLAKREQTYRLGPLGGGK